MNLGPCPVCGKSNWVKAPHFTNGYDCNECGARVYFPYVISISREWLKRHPELEVD